MIQIYYGFGKGKTTAAIGQGMRAKGAGNTVTLVQFLKDDKSSELSVLPFDIFNAPDTLPFNPGKESITSRNSSRIIILLFADYIKSTACFFAFGKSFLTVYKQKCKCIIGNGY